MLHAFTYYRIIKPSSRVLIDAIFGIAPQTLGAVSQKSKVFIASFRCSYNVTFFHGVDIIYKVRFVWLKELNRRSCMWAVSSSAYLDPPRVQVRHAEPIRSSRRRRRTAVFFTLARRPSIWLAQTDGILPSDEEYIRLGRNLSSFLIVYM